MAAAREAGWPVVFGLPNRASAHIFVRDLGWEEVGQLRPWTFVLVSDAGARAERMKVSRLAAATVPWTANDHHDGRQVGGGLGFGFGVF